MDKRFSTLQRVEIAEMSTHLVRFVGEYLFQYSSTSRNCRNHDRRRGVCRTRQVSVLFNESKLPKSGEPSAEPSGEPCFSTLQRVEIAEMPMDDVGRVQFRPFQYSSTSRNCRNPRTERGVHWEVPVSVLFNESKLPKCQPGAWGTSRASVSVLFNESKLPKLLLKKIFDSIGEEFQYSSTSRNCRNRMEPATTAERRSFQYSSTSRNCRNAQRAARAVGDPRRFSTLQRVEIAEILRHSVHKPRVGRFQYSSTSRNCRNSYPASPPPNARRVSVLFNESKLPKSLAVLLLSAPSALFQYSSTSRNCRNAQTARAYTTSDLVSVLFNESKLPKCMRGRHRQRRETRVSVLFNESKLPKS